MKYTITPGQIEINEDGVTQIIDHDNVKVFELDLASKYPGNVVDWSTLNQKGVLLFAGERTLYANISVQEPTCFTLDLEDGGEGDAWDWIIVATGSRYTIRVVVYRVER